MTQTKQPTSQELLLVLLQPGLPGLVRNSRFNPLPFPLGASPRSYWYQTPDYSDYGPGRLVFISV